MKQGSFEEQYQPVWRQLEAILNELETKKKSAVDRQQLSRFANYYRQTCYHYSIAKTRQYSPHLIARLHDLVLRAHQHLYSSRHFIAWRILQFIFVDFPVAVRNNSRFFWLSTALLFLPGLIIGLLCYYFPEVVYSVMSEDEVFGFEVMYSPSAEVLGRSRESATDFLMFGYYIKHNIGIGFRTFAGGLLFGIGTVFTLLFNGTFLGAVAGYLTQLGYTETFWPFVSGHGAFELTAICICGAAGLRLAFPLFAPGRL
ncbi:MAG: stage II sporulation protein M, partial [Gammaproteobacteria bacterium]